MEVKSEMVRRYYLKVRKQTRLLIGKLVLLAKQYYFRTAWSHSFFFLSHWYFRSLVPTALRSGLHNIEQLLPLGDQILQK